MVEIIGKAVDRVRSFIVGVGDEFYVDFVCFGVVVEGVDGQVVDGIGVGVNEFKAEFVGVGVCGCKLHG